MPSVAFFTPLPCGNRHTDRYNNCDLQLKERGKVKSFVNIVTTFLARFGYDNINIFERKLQESESLGIDLSFMEEITMTFILIAVIIALVIRLALLKIELNVLSLYMRDIGKLPDGDTVSAYSKRAVKKFLHIPR